MHLNFCSDKLRLVYKDICTGSPHIRLEQTTFIGRGIGHVLCFVSAIF